MPPHNSARTKSAPPPAGAAAGARRRDRQLNPPSNVAARNRDGAACSNRSGRRPSGGGDAAAVNDAAAGAGSASAVIVAAATAAGADTTAGAAAAVAARLSTRRGGGAPSPPRASTIQKVRVELPGKGTTCGSSQEDKGRQITLTIKIEAAAATATTLTTAVGEAAKEERREGSEGRGCLTTNNAWGFYRQWWREGLYCGGSKQVFSKDLDRMMQEKVRIESHAEPMPAEPNTHTRVVMMGAALQFAESSYHN